MQVSWVDTGNEWCVARWDAGIVVDELYIAIACSIISAGGLSACLGVFWAQCGRYQDPDWSEDEWAARRVFWQFLLPGKDADLEEVVEIDQR